VRPTELSIALRRRTPWEACDLGLAMLQQWWRPAYGAHLVVGAALAALAIAVGSMAGRVWLAFLIVWWLKPLYDRVVLHVLSRAVFGDLQQPRAVLAHSSEWLGTGLLMALTFGRFDLARSFNLPVRQLEDLRGGEGRRRRGLLGRRSRGHAVWLTVLCLHLEFVVLLSLDSLLDLLVPAKANEGLSLRQLFLPGGVGDAIWTLRDAAVYAAAVLLFEPLYVAAGFGLYLNRRIQLEGWDIEMSLRAIVEKRSAKLSRLGSSAAVLMLAFMFIAFPPQSHAQEAKDPKLEMAEVLKDPQFGRWEERTSWQRRSPNRPREREDDLWLRAFGFSLGEALQVLAWIAAIAAIAWLAWRLIRLLPRPLPAPREAYRPPPSLFGMELAPESLPQDVATAAEALAREGRIREALSLLYRGALSDIVHKRAVELLPGHTEGEALRLAQRALGPERGDYFEHLVSAWAACAYARRLPAREEVGRLAGGYRTAFA
jgi:hypothetical protein